MFNPNKFKEKKIINKVNFCYKSEEERREIVSNYNPEKILKLFQQIQIKDKNASR